MACLMALCAMAQIDAIKVTQGETTDWYPFGKSSRIDVSITNGNPVFPEKTYDLAQGNVTTSFGTAPEDTWFTVRKDVTSGNWNTICMERKITDVDGATFWNVVSETETEFTLEQESAPFAAGVGYIIRYTATELKVKYGDQEAVTPVEATTTHPIQGNFAEITCDQEGGNVLVGNYVVYQNQLCKVMGWVTMASNHAYVVADLVPDPSHAPAAKGPRMTMAKPNNTPTSLEMQGSRCTMHNGKYLINGQFVIVRDNKTYTIEGLKIED